MQPRQRGGCWERLLRAVFAPPRGVHAAVQARRLGLVQQLADAIGAGDPSATCACTERLQRAVAAEEWAALLQAWAGTPGAHPEAVADVHWHMERNRSRYGRCGPSGDMEEDNGTWSPVYRPFIRERVVAVFNGGRPACRCCHLDA